MNNLPQALQGREIPCPEMNNLGYRILTRGDSDLPYWEIVWWPTSQDPNWEKAIGWIIIARTETERLQQLLHEVVEVNQGDPYKAGLVEAAQRAMQRLIEEANHAE